VPLPVAGGLSFATASIGTTHACGVTPSGAAYCWGMNDHGQLGDGTMQSSATPIAVSGNLTAKENRVTRVGRRPLVIPFASR
jgi:alpha-tubulin suppressor-like RCC1 family protein